jgi:hypothetical protein
MRSGPRADARGATEPSAARNYGHATTTLVSASLDLSPHVLPGDYPNRLRHGWARGKAQQPGDARLCRIVLPHALPRRWSPAESTELRDHESRVFPGLC